MSENRRFGLLLVSGAHTHQEDYARAFAMDHRCRIVGLTDESGVSRRREFLNRELARELNVDYLPDFEIAIARDDVDFASICAEPERRGKVSSRCVAAGLHVYVDKPIASSIDSARQLDQAVAEARVINHCFSLVRSSMAQQAKALIGSGRLGRLVGIHCDCMFAKGPAGTADLSTIRREHVPVDRFSFADSKRELFCVGWYPLMLFQWLTQQQFEFASAVTANYFFEQHQKHDVEDFAAMTIRLTGGIIASMTVGRCGWNSVPAGGIHRIRLTGTDGSESLDAFQTIEPRESPAIDSWRPKTDHPDDPMGFWSSTQSDDTVAPQSMWRPVGSPVLADTTYFLDCLQSGCQSDVPVSMGLEAVRLMHGGYESAAEKRAVDIS